MQKEVEESDYSSAMADAQEVAASQHIIIPRGAAGQHIVSEAGEIQLHSTYTQTQPNVSDDERADEERNEEQTSTRVVYHSVAVQTQPDPEFDSPTYSVITGDGSVAYDTDGVRVLRAIGTWTPDYQSSEQYSDQSVEGYINGTESVVVRNANAVSVVTSASPNSSATSNGVVVTPSTSRSVRDGVPSQQVVGIKPATGDKAFMCPVCNKGLARKDKLVIHMRIHTGEKPYVCEVCDRAFARRDKLVMHMNKLKHITPSNIAPLGKRQHQPSTSGVSVIPEKRQDVKVEEPNSIEMGSPASSVDLQPAALVQVVHEQPTMTWNCELCGRICMSREEWTAHARSHLDGDNSFGASSVSSSLSVLTPLSSYQYSGGASQERQQCVVCRQEFPNKTDLILHLRGHFVGKPELLASHVASIVDPSGVCSQAV